MICLFHREEALALIRNVEELPTLPDRFCRIREIAKDESADADDLAAVIGTDQATTAAILKCADSVAYNPAGTPIASLRLAIARIGFKEAARIAMAMSLMYGFSMPVGMYQVRSLWAHAFCVGLFYQHLVAKLRPDGDDRFVTGLLHDIGRLVIGLRLDMDYFESDLAQLHGAELVAAERRKYGLDHAEAGAELLAFWRLPAPLCRIIANHHNAEAKDWEVRLLALADHEAHRRLPAGMAIENIEAALMPQFEADSDELLRQIGLAKSPSIN